MTPCPECSAPSYVTDSRLTVGGNRRRRFRCTACDYRWTERNGPRPPMRLRGATANPQRLPDDAIADMLTSDELPRQLAARWGCHLSTVKKVRRGELHRNVLPELRRYQ